VTGPALRGGEKGRGEKGKRGGGTEGRMKRGEKGRGEKGKRGEWEEGRREEGEKGNKGEGRRKEWKEGRMLAEAQGGPWRGIQVPQRRTGRASPSTCHALLPLRCKGARLNPLYCAATWGRLAGGGGQGGERHCAEGGQVLGHTCEGPGERQGPSL